jgi:hypothetical protein
MNASLRSRWSPVVVLAALASSMLTQSTQSAQGKGEDDVKAAFVQLQSAFKAKDAAKVWAMLDSDTQADADKTAKKVKLAYKKFNDTEKAEYTKNLGLTADEFARLDGQLLVKSKRFMGKYDEIGDCKITSITVQGDTAVVNYTEADGDKEKVNYTKQAGKWKVALPMPSFAK